MNSCIVCKSDKLESVINLGLHTPADTFLKFEDSLSQKFHNLSCELCLSCGHFQNQYLVSSKERYEDTDYSYTSSNSNISKNHWIDYFESVIKKANIQSNDSIIEFGSNDGFLTSQFHKSFKIIGIEPSKYLADLSSKEGLNIINEYLSLKSINKAVQKNGKCKLIYGNNVFNHIHEINEATKAIKFGLLDDGYFVFESPYLLDIIQKYFFDTIYHEHISYFSIKAIDYLLSSNGLFITDIERNDYHGGCIRVFSSPNKANYNTSLVESFISTEIESGLFDLNTYKNFMNKIENDKFNTVNSLIEMKKKGLNIVAIGAAARSNTLLNYYKLDSSVINFITDSSPHKIGKYTPGSCIPILSDDALNDKNLDVAIILSWNIGKYLVKKINQINPNLKVISLGDKELL